MNVGYKIRKIRESKGIKQQTIANVLGISQSAYHKIETEKTQLKMNDLVKIVEELQISLADIIKDDNDNNNDNNNDNDNDNDNDKIINAISFENERKVWEKLVESKDAEIAVLKNIIATMQK